MGEGWTIFRCLTPSTTGFKSLVTLSIMTDYKTKSLPGDHFKCRFSEGSSRTHCMWVDRPTRKTKSCTLGGPRMVRNGDSQWIAEGEGRVKSVETYAPQRS